MLHGEGRCSGMEASTRWNVAVQAESKAIGSPRGGLNRFINDTLAEKDVLRIYTFKPKTKGIYRRHTYARPTGTTTRTRRSINLQDMPNSTVPRSAVGIDRALNLRI